ncbi:beta-lactamase-like protein [Chaetomium strumarium]|uniref:Beta-lactamase-like protein n=1 Tax=Chaetomium strumarium TaxID=1170767 RepID=A0AAJ0H1T2_9PEZI|nr:beta-lactamase-like protein [Chaetomium strumarium]
MTDTSRYLVCNTCGTQHPTADRTALTRCFICDDPRQYTPPSGQSFTTLADLRSSSAGEDQRQRHNEFLPLIQDDPRFTCIVTKPAFAIGQRAILIRTPRGNVLWDCVSYIDDDTVARVSNEMGGIQAMVISHPHFYSTHLEWAERFGCPVYLAREDRGWLARRDEQRQVFLDGVETRVEINGEDTGVRVVKLGGHFPGSLVLLYDGHLFTADTLMMTPAGRANWAVDALGNPRERPQGINTFSFLWSIPNMIPLSADEIARMWGILRNYDFKSAHGLFMGADIADENIKARVLESMQIQVRAMGHAGHALMRETL